MSDCDVTVVVTMAFVALPSLFDETGSNVVAVLETLFVTEMVVCGNGAVTVNVLLEVLRTPEHARWILYAAVLLATVGPALAAARTPPAQALRLQE